MNDAAHQRTLGRLRLLVFAQQGFLVLLAFLCCFGGVTLPAVGAGTALFGRGHSGGAIDDAMRDALLCLFGGLVVCPGVIASLALAASRMKRGSRTAWFIALGIELLLATMPTAWIAVTSPHETETWIASMLVITLPLTAVGLLLIPLRPSRRIR